MIFSQFHNNHKESRIFSKNIGKFGIILWELRQKGIIFGKLYSISGKEMVQKLLVN